MYLPHKYGLIRRAIRKGSNFPEATTIEDAKIETKRSGRGVLSPPTTPIQGLSISTVPDSDMYHRLFVRLSYVFVAECSYQEVIVLFIWLKPEL
jgi:hypothetical protein